MASACTGAPSRPANPLKTEELVSATPTARVTPSAHPLVSTPTFTNTPPGTWITLSPNSGKPGTVIQIDGYFAGDLTEQELINNSYLTHGDVCWGGCQDGLLEGAVDVNWSATEPGHFSLQIVVPSAPWLTSDGLHPLQPGDYPITIQSLDLSTEECPSGKGCPVVPLASALFHLSSGYKGSGCQDQSCGILHTQPSEGAPADLIQVTGWAPLIEIIGRPIGYYLMLETKTGAPVYQNMIDLATVQQEMDGSLTATFRVPQYEEDGLPIDPGTYILALDASLLTLAKGGPPTMIAPTSFEITSAPSWVARPRAAPLWIQPAGSIVETLSVDLSNPKRLAYCETGSIRYTQDGGQNWASIPTTAVKNLPPSSGTIVGNQGAELPACISVTLDSIHPDSFYAIFSAVDEQYGPPPIYYVGYFTTDLGKTWQLVPVPSVQMTLSGSEGKFGGFWTDGRVIQALYAGEALSPDQAPPAQAKETTNGGITWNPTSLTCPSSGPCLRWGPAPGAIYGMGSDLLQGVMASYDNGQTWQPTDQSAELRQGWPFQLVALSQNEALMINGSPPYQMLFTPDRGRTWQALALPPFPEANSGWPSEYPSLQMLPDGSLLSMNSDTGKWWVLPADAQGWCASKITSLDKYLPLLQVIGDRVWWLSEMGMPESAPLSSFVCQP
ncbi:MAG: sialidase family protein [Anaerolineales bacterium]